MSLYIILEGTQPTRYSIASAHWGLRPFIYHMWCLYIIMARYRHFSLIRTKDVVTEVMRLVQILICKHKLRCHFLYRVKRLFLGHLSKQAIPVRSFSNCTVTNMRLWLYWDVHSCKDCDTVLTHTMRGDDLVWMLQTNKLPRPLYRGAHTHWWSVNRVH